MDKVEETATRFRQANDNQVQLTASEAARQAQTDRFDFAARVRDQRQEAKKK